MLHTCETAEHSCGTTRTLKELILIHSTELTALDLLRIPVVELVTHAGLR